jgi:hypothetical protein
MEALLANLVVAALVALAFVQVCRRYLPASWRRRLLQVLANMGLPARLLARADQPASGCGSGCSSCDTCAAAPAAAPDGRRVIRIAERR